MRSAVLVIIFHLFTLSVLAQSYSLSGVIVDKKDGLPIVGITVKVIHENDSARTLLSVTNDSGFFKLEKLEPGKYMLELKHLGYKEKSIAVVLANKDKYLEKIYLELSSSVLKEVIIKDNATRIEMFGDTTQFNADAYKTHPDANVEDLIKKMPGVTYDNNGLKVNGETVEKVLVDGKDFFSNDPSVALKNLPADMISKVQVFDNVSDQDRFMGFNDGSANKAMNFITKEGKNKGQFGKVYGGYGTDERYNTGGNLNLFNGDQRLSVIGLFNNINQQNFSIADIMGLMSNSGSGRRNMQGPPPDSRQSNTNNYGGSQGFGPGNMLYDQKNGNTVTSSLGVNYNDNIGKKIKLSGSYFYNATKNINESELTRSYFTGDAPIYRQGETAETDNINHRVNLRLEYTIDSYNSVIWTPQLSVQQNNYVTDQAGFYTYASSGLANSTTNHQATQYTGYSFSNNLLLRHKFRKKGRTISLDMSANLNGQDGEGSYESSVSTEQNVSEKKLDQEFEVHNNSNTFSGKLAYSEPVGNSGQLILSYNPSYTPGIADKKTNDADTVTGDHSVFNSALSNTYRNSYITQKGGLTYRYQYSKINFTAGADIQQARLNGDQTFPVAYKVDNTFSNILPSAMFNYRWSKGKDVRVFYRSSTNIPSLAQLQNVIDNSNPLVLSTGNTTLKQSYEHRLSVFYRTTNRETARSFFSVLSGRVTNNYISTHTIFPSADTTIQGVTVKQGSQLSIPVNMNGYYAFRVFGVYSRPVGFLRSNININGSVDYTRTPSQINNEINVSDNTALNIGGYLGSNISTYLDFSISYNGTYNLVSSSLQSQSDYNYFTHTATAKLNWIFLKRFVLNSDVNFTSYSGLSESYDQSYVLWNGYLGYKFLKNRQLELKASVFDILNQNTSVNRTITQTYTEDNISNVLRRYAMLTLTYTIKNYKNKLPENGDMPPMPPPGMPPPRRF